MRRRNGWLAKGVCSSPGYFSLPATLINARKANTPMAVETATPARIPAPMRLLNIRAASPTGNPITGHQKTTYSIVQKSAYAGS